MAEATGQRRLITKGYIRVWRGFLFAGYVYVGSPALTVSPFIRASAAPAVLHSLQDRSRSWSALVTSRSIRWCDTVVCVGLVLCRHFFTFSFTVSFIGLIVDYQYKPHSTLDTCIRMALARWDVIDYILVLFGAFLVLYFKFVLNVKSFKN